MSAAFALAPASKSAATMSAFPVAAPLCNGVFVSSSVASMSALASTKILTTPGNFEGFAAVTFRWWTSPCAARCRGVQPDSFRTSASSGLLDKKACNVPTLPRSAARSAGVTPAPAFNVGSAAPLSSRISTTSTQSARTALCRAVSWIASCTSTSTRPMTNSSAKSEWPSSAAMCSAVLLCRSRVLTMMPRRMSSWVICKWPPRAATCSAQEPSASSDDQLPGSWQLGTWSRSSHTLAPTPTKHNLRSSSRTVFSSTGMSAMASAGAMGRQWARPACASP
mmetsp:Transcript_68877/g.193211  ORF Transcript_68877/g.193211 Transcript_68877/m.193211 type:complete len:280 (+) Transcript_68877:424-1263(+)